MDGDFSITVDEFVDQCMQLHGAARSVDLPRGSVGGCYVARGML